MYKGGNQSHCDGRRNTWKRPGKLDHITIKKKYIQVKCTSYLVKVNSVELKHICDVDLLKMVTGRITKFTISLGV
jgi:hypothetical protein